MKAIFGAVEALDRLLGSKDRTDELAARTELVIVLIRMVFSKLLAFICILGFTAPVWAAEVSRACQGLFIGEPSFQRFDATHTLSQAVRDNAADYWWYMRTAAPKYLKPELLSYQGLVFGDHHAGNVVFGPWNNRVRYFDADLKDAGIAAFILDFERAVIATHSIFKRVEDRPRLPKTLATLFDAYVAGLRGTKMEPPKEIRPFFSLTIADYREMEEAYVAKKTAYDRFKLKEGKVAPFNAASLGVSQESVEKIKAGLVSAIQVTSPNAEILDFAIRPRERGGSAKLARYWVLVRVKGRLDIVEFKGVGDPATAFYGPQTVGPDRFNAVAKILIGSTDPSNRTVSVAGQELQIRPKKIEMFQIPYKAEDVDQQAFVLDVNAFDVNLLGPSHAKQLRDSKYAAYLVSHRDEILEGLRLLAKDYIDRVETKAGVQ